MIRRPPRSTRTDTLFPYTTLFRSDELSSILFSVLLYDSFDSGGIFDLPRTSEVDLIGALALQHLTSFRRRGDLKSEGRSEEHTSELQSLMRISYAVFCLKKKKKIYDIIICQQ